MVLFILANSSRLELSKILWSKISFKETNEMAKHKQGTKRKGKLCKLQFITKNNNFWNSSMNNVINPAISVGQNCQVSKKTDPNIDFEGEDIFQGDDTDDDDIDDSSDNDDDDDDDDCR